MAPAFERQIEYLASRPVLTVKLHFGRNICFRVPYLDEVIRF